MEMLCKESYFRTEMQVILFEFCIFVESIAYGFTKRKT